MNQSNADAIRIDQRLIEQISMGGSAAWNVIYAQTKPKVIGYLVRREINHSLALELFQEALIVLEQKKSELFLTCRLHVYLISVARNKLREYWRKQEKNPEQLIDDFNTLDRNALGDDPLEMAELDLLQLAFSDNSKLLGETTLDDKFQEALAQLSEKCATLFKLRFWEDLDDRQIAKVLGMEYDMVRKQIYKCKERFKVIYTALFERKS